MKLIYPVLKTLQMLFALEIWPISTKVSTALHICALFTPFCAVPLVTSKLAMEPLWIYIRYKAAGQVRELSFIGFCFAGVGKLIYKGLNNIGKITMRVSTGLCKIARLFLKIQKGPEPAFPSIKDLEAAKMQYLKSGDISSYFSTSGKSIVGPIQYQ